MQPILTRITLYLFTLLSLAVCAGEQPPFPLDPISHRLAGSTILGSRYDNLTGTSWTGQYTQNLNHWLAVSGLLEYGKDNYRLSTTLGFNLFSHGLIKLSAEHLAQVLPFQFSSGFIDQRVAQNAYGIRYQYQLDGSLLNKLELGGYYAKAQSLDLAPIELFDPQGIRYLNYRHIAGGISQGLDIAAQWKISPSTTLASHLYYDSIYYATQYTDHSIYDRSGLGGSLTVTQQLSQQLELTASGKLRQIYNTYQAGLTWFPPLLAQRQFSLALVGQRLISHNPTPNSTLIGLQASLNLEALAAAYRSSAQTSQLSNPEEDLRAWTAKPAVYMNRVLAVAEQKNIALAPLLTNITPNTGPSAGGTVIILTGANFAQGAVIHFDGEPIANVQVIDSTKIALNTPSHVPGRVSVTVINPNGQTASLPNGYTYQAPPTPPEFSSLSPDEGYYEFSLPVIITGSHLDQVTHVYFGTQEKHFSYNPATGQIETESGTIPRPEQYIFPVPIIVDTTTATGVDTGLTYTYFIEK